MAHLCLASWGAWEAEIFAYWGHPLASAYTECRSMLARAVDSLGHGYSFDASRVKLLLAPKRFGVLEGARQTERCDVVFGVDLAHLGGWLLAQGGDLRAGRSVSQASSTCAEKTWTSTNSALAQSWPKSSALMDGHRPGELS